MAVRSQTKEEKEQFFAELERLGNSSGSETESASEDERVIVARLAARNQSAKPRSPPKSPPVTIVIEDSPVKTQSRTTRTSSPLIDRPRNVKQSTNKIIKCVAKRQTSSTGNRRGETLTNSDKQSNNKDKAPKSDKPKRALIRKAKAKDEIQMLPERLRIFNGLKFFFIPNNTIAKPRRKRIEKSIERGAIWATTYDESVTHVIVDIYQTIGQIAREFEDKQIPESANILKDTWLIDGLVYGYLSSETATRYRFKELRKPVEQPKPVVAPEPSEPNRHPATRKRKVQEIESPTPRDYPARYCPPSPRDELGALMEEIKDLPASSSDADDCESLGSSVAETVAEEDTPTQNEAVPKTPKDNRGFQCMQSHDGTKDGPNARTIELLQKMTSYYDRTGDQWRTLSYRKGIAALTKQTSLVRTREQAIRIPGIGGRLAEKNEEIASTDKLRRLENTGSEPTDVALQLFMGIYDVGHKQASKWVAQGHRTLDDLVKKVKLSPNQKIGIERYDDFQQRIPRAEVEQHAEVVRQALEEADLLLDITIGGSYRRGIADSGDIDCLIHKKDADIHEIRKLMMGTVIPRLEARGFLKAALATSSVKTASKWHGASCLSSSKVWRRIDFLFVPWESLGAARIYTTGNDIFNRSMRLLARKKGMTLNQHGLYEDVARDKDGEKLTEGRLVAGHSEGDIFEKLSVPWRQPHERQC